MSKTIYISDLDGTLLNSQKKVPDHSIEVLNKLIDEDKIHFSIATARTPATVENLLNKISIKEPIIVMNGVSLYDLKTHKYSQVEYIIPKLVMQIVEKLGHWIKQGFIYTITNNKLRVYYDELIGDGRIGFYEERKVLKYKEFIRQPLPSYENIIYFVFIDTKENIQTIKSLLQDVEGIEMVMYKDIYSKESYLLEVYSMKATKANGIRKLRSIGQFKRVISFGDQLNDLSMFQEADEAYAVGNAAKEVKALATAVIGTNNEGSVAKFIEQHIKCQCREEE